MPRPKTKEELLSAATSNYDKLMTVISQLSEAELTTEFDFSQDEKKQEAHWQRDKKLRDVLGHLYEWQQMLLKWVEKNQAGEETSFLPAPYNWRTYGELNQIFFRKHQSTSLKKIKQLLEKSQQEVLVLATSFSDEELFTKGFYPWVGGSSLGSYFISSTSSHYEWAIKKIKAHQKNVPR